jgi:hypothetical protein
MSTESSDQDLAEQSRLTRRDMLKTAAAGVAVSTATISLRAAIAAAPVTKPGWELEPMRWSQVAFTDDDPQRFDPQFWYDHWKRAKIDGTCLSAGGVTAYYPTKVPLHTRPPALGNTDPLGDMIKAARSLNMKVLARVDPHAISAECFAAHPDWAARAADGTPRRHPTAPDLYLACGNGPVNFEWMPLIIAEIVENYQPDAIFGNRWAGSAGVCYCQHCKEQFRAFSGFDVPAASESPTSPARRAYLRWEDEKRFAQIKLWDDVVKKYNPNGFFTPGTTGRLDPARLRTTIKAIYSDRQGRSGTPSWSNGKSAKEARALMQDKPVAGIFSIGYEDDHRWKDSVQAPAETIAYAQDGIAQGFRPWHTKFKAETFDKRWMEPVEKLYQWHQANERYFRHTANLARVAIVSSAQSITYYGRSAAGAGPEHGGSGPGAIVTDALNGFYQALVEAKIPFEMVDDRDLSPAAVDRFRVLILPNVAAMSDAQASQIKDYVARGGRIVATYETSLYDEWGTARSNFALADLFGCDYAGKVLPRVQNSYITIPGANPFTRGLTDTPRVIAATSQVLVKPRDNTAAPLTLVPSYPDLPMERVFTSQWTTNIPAVYARQVGKGRVVYFPSNIDRTFWDILAEDHLKLLRNAVEWAAEEPQPLIVTGAGMLDLAYWRQSNSVTAHLVNLQNPMMMTGFNRENVPTGAFTVSLALPANARVKSVKLLESGRTPQTAQRNGRLEVQVPSVLVHEVVAVDL